ncbi:MAG: demethoxyubiquinone hydroxylase family protein [Rickettsiaceae bacterium]|nr:demethoxyubiquinone hydroxylase family protein [Rickettsiaceae bacterium]
MKKPVFNNNKKISEFIRVNYAGEYGANLIYQGQLDAAHQQVKREIIQEIIHMQAQEKVHLDYFSNEMKERRVRPSILMGFWHYFGYILGYTSSMLGPKYAMICTDSVESVIEEHYQKQIDYLNSFTKESILAKKFAEFKNEEIDHKNIASAYIKSYGFMDFIFYKLVGKICKLAIFASKKI